MSGGKIKNRVLQAATIVPVLFALVVWGGWAFYVNSLAGDYSQALRSGLTQGLYSGVMTFYMSLSVLFFYQRTKDLKFWFILPTLGTVGHTGAALVLFHFLNHTPNILLTVSVPLSVAAAYCLYLTRTYSRK